MVQVASRREPGLGEPVFCFDAILDQGIVGYRPRARATAAALQAVCDGGVRTKDWPEGVGKSYANVLKSTLTRSPEEIEEAAKSVDARRLWEATRPFREDTLDAAREATPKGGGIRRGAIYAALAAQLPSPPAAGEVEDSGRLVARFKDAHDPRTGDLAHFLAWVDGLYQVNHAQTLSAQPWIPPMDPFDSLVVSLAGTQPEASASAPEPATELEIEVRLPKIDRLFGHHDPAAVLAIREEAGADYRRTLRFPSLLLPAS